MVLAPEAMGMGLWHWLIRYVLRSDIWVQDTGLYYLQSRYYNPTIGRFINADIYTSTGQGVLGNNMFAYCGNNPIANVDQTGQYYCKISFDAFCPLDSQLVNLTGGSGGGSGLCWSGSIAQKPKREGTTSRGITISAAYGVAVAVAFGYTCDENGNFGFYLTLSIGGGTPTAGISESITKTNAPTIYDQRGWGMSMGGAVSLVPTPVSIGAEYNMLVDNSWQHTYSGTTTNVGVGIGLPAEFHGTIDYTWVWDIWDIWNSLLG